MIDPLEMKLLGTRRKETEKEILLGRIKIIISSFQCDYPPFPKADNYQRVLCFNAEAFEENIYEQLTNTKFLFIKSCDAARHQQQSLWQEKYKPA